MDKETRQAFETRDKILDGMRAEMDSLIASFKDSKEAIEGKLQEFQGDLSSLRDSADTSDAALQEQAVEENAKLNERVAYLEGDDYKNHVIQDFLRDLDSDNFLAIGVKLGYLESTEAEPGPLQDIGDEPVEVPLGDNQVLLMQKKKPEDMTGWEYSEGQKVYLKFK